MALALFRRDGFDATTVDGIAEAAVLALLAGADAGVVASAGPRSRDVAADRRSGSAAACTAADGLASCVGTSGHLLQADRPSC